MESVLLWLAVVVVALMVAASAGSGGAEQAKSPHNHDSDVATDDQLRWIVSEYGTMVYRVAVAIVHDPALAEDVVQDTFLKAWLSLPSWEASTAAPWLRRVARNTAISVWRRRARIDDDPEMEQRAASDAGVEWVVENRVLAQAVWGALEQLDPDSKTLIVMSAAEELSYEEMAHLLGVSVPAVKAKLYRARQTLRAALRDWEL
ncbi:MAG: RNA polymerase sigma factor [Actinobacteria bacterium]|nr:RNA polymerase sigma factor [Actinomycetota bacterium]